MYQKVDADEDEVFSWNIKHGFLIAFWTIGFVGNFLYTLTNIGILVFHAILKLFRLEHNFSSYIFFVDYSVFFGGPIILFAFGGLITHSFFFNDFKQVYYVNTICSWTNFIISTVSIFILSINLFFDVKGTSDIVPSADMLPFEMDAIILFIWGSLYIVSSKNYFQKKHQRINKEQLNDTLTKKSILISILWWIGMFFGFFLETILLITYVEKHKFSDELKFIYLVPLILLLEFTSSAGLAMKSIQNSLSKKKLYLISLGIEILFSCFLVLFQVFKVIYLIISYNYFNSDHWNHHRKNSIQNWYLASGFVLLFCKVFSFGILIIFNLKTIIYSFKNSTTKTEITTEEIDIWNEQQQNELIENEEIKQSDKYLTFVE